MDFKVCAKIVGMEGIRCEAVIRNNGSIEDIQVVACPKELKFTGKIVFTGNEIKLEFMGIKPGRGKVQLLIEGFTYTIPFVVFKEKEFFLAMVISSNYHIGFDPENYVFGFDEDNGNICGHAFRKACRTLGKDYHEHGLPVTWLIDPVVAAEGNEKIDNWHNTYYDDYGVMPSSWFNHNKNNYNTEFSLEETVEMLASSVTGVEDKFNYYTNIVGIDQWVGSVGSHFVKACEILNLKGIWGMGYDHFTCDTSMFHRGCPWDMYKPDRNDIKIPCTYPSDMWAFQWTTRDIINTVHTPTGASGSVVFSTDADDIRQTNILQKQKDYYTMLFREFKSNMKYNDFFVFLVHQEDHDMHFEEDNIYLNDFLKDIKGESTPATLEEIVQWLNLKYPKEKNSTQVLSLKDILTCRNEVQWGYGGVQKPENWDNYKEGFPLHGAYFGSDAQVIVQKPLRKPIRVYDYGRRYDISETDSYPEEYFGEIEVLEEAYVMEAGVWKYSATILVETGCERFPLVLWDYPQELRERLAVLPMVHTDDFILCFLELEAGENKITQEF